jgi:hypothetical protein
MKIRSAGRKYPRKKTGDVVIKHVNTNQLEFGELGGGGGDLPIYVYVKNHIFN